MTRRHAPLLLLTPLLLAAGSLATLSCAPTPAHAAPAPAAAGMMKNVYVLRLLNDTGHVWTVQVDAATGSVK